MENKITQNILVVTLLGVILLLNILSIRHKMPNTDEKRHFEYGLQILNLNSTRPYPSTMPFTCLNAIPYKIEKSLKHEEAVGFPDNANTARYITVLFSLLLAFYVFKWSKELYGIRAGFFSLILYTFSPNIIAHSRLVTTDLYAACMITISTYYFWQFIRSGGWRKAGLSAFTLGLSQLAKYTCVYLYPIYIFIIIVKYPGNLLKSIKTGDFESLIKYLKTFFKYVLIFMAISVIIINIGFLFNRTLTPLKEYKFKSSLFESTQSKLGILKELPVPLPYPFIEGLDWVKHIEQTRGYIYLFGKLQGGGEEYKGFNGYAFYTFLFKVPIAIQLFIFFSIIAYILRYRKYNFLENELFLFCPILFFAIYFNFFFKCQIGIRYFLVMLPFLHIFCGSLIKNWQTLNMRFKGLIILLGIYLIISVMSYFPHYISYFNELVWDRKQAYKILADSNIDWGQNYWYLKKYEEKHPNIQINPKIPVTGRIVVGINKLVGISFGYYKANVYKWLRENYEPIDHIAYSYLVYDIPSEHP